MPRQKTPTVANAPTCAGCYWFRPKSKEYGVCKRFPPVVLAVDEDGFVMSAQAAVHKEEEACGEFQLGPRVFN